MNEIKASLLFGGLLVVFGIVLIRWHMVVWARHRQPGECDERELRHFQVQFRRRLQVSSLLILLGIMIPVGDALIMQKRRPGMVAGYWIVVLLFVLWIVVLAGLDWLSSRLHLRSTRVALSRLEQKRRELEDEVERLRRHNTNGHHS